MVFGTPNENTQGKTRFVRKMKACSYVPWIRLESLLLRCFMVGERGGSKEDRTSERNGHGGAMGGGLVVRSST